MLEDKLKRYFALLRNFSNILMNDLIDSPSAQTFDLKLSQMNAISAFLDEQPLSMNDLARNCMVKLPNMTKMVDSLVKDGVVTRRKDTADRRRVLVCLTPKGKKIRSQFLKNRRKTALSILAGLSPEEKNDLLGSMEHVCSILDRAIQKSRLAEGSVARR